jgi:uncharacterized protein (DUF1330 family)
MTAYLVLDFTIHDLRGFMPYVAAIPAVMERRLGAGAARDGDEQAGFGGRVRLRLRPHASSED